MLLNKKQKVFSFIIATFFFIQPFSLTGANVIVSADTIHPNEELQKPETKEVALPELFENVQKHSEEKLTEVADASEITTLIDENDNVRAAEITNVNSDETIVITNNGDSVIIETTIIGDNGESKTTQEIFPIIRENTQDNLLQSRLVYSGWSYTHLAVGRNAFSVVAGMAISKITAAFAAIFGISGAAASFAVGYMGIKSGMSAANLAKYLDSNGNGWIALYKRYVRNYKGGPIIGTQHRTY
ncbi:hypothetical protein IGJ91_002970 [Enterococcus sp. DIV0765f]|uniref:hypothetical protein n=1 Tax=Enterococcus sp. DIV0765f TaxID=2774783 RepID=UPI003F23F634